VTIQHGKPFPLGATPDSDGVNFSLFSANAERIELCLFDADGKAETQRLSLPAKTGDIWHGHVEGLQAGAKYGYRVHGPYEPENGHRFNPNKLLIDPYARELSGTLIDSDENLGYICGHPDADLSFDERDNAHNIPKCVVCSETSKRSSGVHTRLPIEDSIIYEAHIKGLTRRFPSMRKSRRGTYSALSSQRVIDYLKSLGITAIELLPVHAFIDDSFLQEKGLNNYWGYNSINFFTPEVRYALNNPREEFRNMVRRLHANGLEVILDVVYNHTAEGNELGPTLCYRGIDNASYYRLEENRRHYANFSGCGNTLNTSHPRVNQLIMDSLRYWASNMQVDGFRFDLATTLARLGSGYSHESPFLHAAIQDPILSQRKLIAEPWDCGLGGYQLGNFPNPFSEWNDQYRDQVRQFWSGDLGKLEQLCKCLHGSSEVFEWSQRGPGASINMITTHDGFTLADLVSYNEKHNEANGEDNNDGHDANYSNNYGHEGPTDDECINNYRNRQRLNFLSTLMLSQGVPMLLAGDEFGNTQEGNNNAYCQDNNLSWLDWKQRAKDNITFEFTQRLINLRKRFPVLRCRNYLHGQSSSESMQQKDIVWLSAASTPMEENDWHNGHSGFVAMLLCGDAETFKSNSDASGSNTSETSSVLIVINGSDTSVPFTLPTAPSEWTFELSTTQPQEQPYTADKNTLIGPHSVTVFSTAPS